MLPGGYDDDDDDDDICENNFYHIGILDII